MDKHPVQGGDVMLLVTSCHRSRTKARALAPLVKKSVQEKSVSGVSEY